MQKNKQNNPDATIRRGHLYIAQENVPVKKIPAIVVTNKKKPQKKDVTVPEQPQGYIKVRRHDFL